MARRLEEVVREIVPAETTAHSPDGQFEDLARDLCFAVRRVDGHHPAIFLRRIIAARVIFLQETPKAPVSIVGEDLELIDQRSSDLLAGISGALIDSVPHVPHHRDRC